MIQSAIEKSESQVSELSQMIDEFGALEQELSIKKDRYETLKKQISKVANATKDGLPCTLSGQQWEIDYTACSEATKCTVSPQELVESTKKWECVSVSITAARKALSDTEIEKFFQKTFGSRKLKRIRPVSLTK